MLLTPIYFLPCVITLLWFFSFLLKVKSDRQKLYNWLLAADVFYYATYAFYISPITDYMLMSVMDVINVPLILIIPAILMVYLAMHWKGIKLNPLQLLLLSPALIIGTVCAMFYLLIGFENSSTFTELSDKGEPLPAEFNTELYRFYEFFDYQVLSVVCLICYIIMAYEVICILRKDNYPLGNTFRFFFKGGKTTPARAAALLVTLKLGSLLPVVIMGRTYVMQNPMVGIFTVLLISVVEHCLAHIEYYSDNQKEITFYYLTHLKLGEPVPVAAVPEEVPVKEEPEPIPSHTSARIRMIQTELQQMLDVEKIYKDENITLNTLAEHFGIGRTTLSQIISSQYGMPFRDLLNSYRIEAVKKYMMENPTATQEVIAYECGFKNASYLNSKFKDVVGETPLMWFNKQILQQK